MTNPHHTPHPHGTLKRLSCLVIRMVVVGRFSRGKLASNEAFAVLVSVDRESVLIHEINLLKRQPFRLVEKKSL